MAKCLFKHPVCSHWNIECGDVEYFHQFARKYPIGCGIFSWNKYQWHGYSAHQKVPQKITRVTKLVDTVASAIDIAVIERSISKALNNDKVDEQDLNMIQALHFEVLNELPNVVHKMETEIRSQLQKRQWEEMNDLRKEFRKRFHMICSLFSVCCLVCYQNG